MIYTDSRSLVESLEAWNWKDCHEWLRLIKTTLSKMEEQPIICWIPSHCNTYGNDKADRLADRGSKCDQDNAPVTFNITKAKIKNEKWKIGHERAREIFEDRRKPKDEESKWPMRVRNMFRRLRCDHATELKCYGKRIGLEASDMCIHCDMDAVENIRHVLTECPQLEARRRSLHPDRFTVSMMTTHPEVCRKLLASRFEELKECRKMVEDEGGGGPSGRTELQA